MPNVLHKVNPDRRTLSREPVIPGTKGKINHIVIIINMLIESYDIIVYFTMVHEITTVYINIMVYVGVNHCKRTHEYSVICYS